MRFHQNVVQYSIRKLFLGGGTMQIFEHCDQYIKDQRAFEAELL